MTVWVRVLVWVLVSIRVVKGGEWRPGGSVREVKRSASIANEQAVDRVGAHAIRCVELVRLIQGKDKLVEQLELRSN